MYASGHLAALDFEGNQLWLRSFGENQSSYGYASSLLAHKGLVFVQWDHDDKKTSGLYAVRGDNGEEFYKVEREATASWTSPSIVSTVKGDQLILIAPERITAYEPLTGKEIWRSGWYFCEPGPSAAWGNGMVYITSDGAETLAIKTDGEGDITQSHVAWKADDALPDTSSPVSSGDHLLQCASGGYLACFKTADGSVAWEHYLPAGATGSPIFVGDDTVYLTTDDGITQVFKLGGDQYEEIGKGDALDSVFATPAFVDGKIYIRGENYLTAIGKNDK
jgi:outer membrane protein assembly factor BamB